MNFGCKYINSIIFWMRGCTYLRFDISIINYAPNFSEFLDESRMIDSRKPK